MNKILEYKQNNYKVQYEIYTVTSFQIACHGMRTQQQYPTMADSAKREKIAAARKKVTVYYELNIILIDELSYRHKIIKPFRSIGFFNQWSGLIYRGCLPRFDSRLRLMKKT